MSISGEKFYSDKERVQMILNALISNAIKYYDETKQEPSINIDINVNTKKASMKVTDNGIGINDDNRKKIFNMFYRGTEVSSGTGLGLYIVKEAVAVLGGDIDVNSEPGKGSSFLITLPNKIPE
jgi:signal transduction histidine kinase